MKYYVIIAMVCMRMLCQSQSTSTLMGARAAGMGYASAVLKDEAAIFNNPGSLTGDKSSAFFAYEVRPEMPGASRTAAGIQIPFKIGVGAFGIFRFGDDLYSEQLLSLGFSNQFGITSLGVKVNYIQYRAEGFATKSALGLDFGGLTQLTPNISVGAYIVNLNQPEISPGERLPTRLVAAIGFKLDEAFLIATEINKEINYPASWRTGFEYTIHKKIFVRSGFNLYPTAVHTGIGAKTRKLKIDYALQFSQALGESHQASLIVQLSKQKK